MSPEALLRFEGLEVVFDDGEQRTEAVRGLDLVIHPGEVVALVGESGSGKSVSVMSAMRLLEGTAATYPAGRILWRGEDVLGMDRVRLHRLRGHEMGIVFQEPMTALNPLHTCGDQVAEALLLHTELDAAARRARVVDLFRQVHLAEPERRVDQYPHELSGGMRQRVCIAMALACDPALLIADEPTTALDVTVQAQILDLLRELQDQRDMAVLFITHDLGVVADIADRVVIMWQGRPVESGSVIDIFERPQHPYTRGLLACRPSLQRIARRGHRRERLPTVADFTTGD
ncbi:MAG: ATP-binding cassette domain-containing protein [Planctomycetota bacterium]